MKNFILGLGATGANVAPPVTNIAGVALSFDDTAYATQWWNYHQNYGAAYGWKATFNLYADDLTNKAASINGLYNAGHEIGNHTINNFPIDPSTYLLTKTEEDYYNEWVAPLNPLISGIIPGFPGCKTFAWPYGNDVISISEWMIANTPITFTRDTGTLGYQEFYYDGTQQVMNGRWIDNGSGRTVADIKALIDTAKQTNTVVTLLAHGIAETTAQYTVKISVLNEILQYINEQGLTYYRHDELLPSLFGL